MIRTSVVGASGYSGAELLRLLHGHKQVEIVHLVANQRSGERLDDVFPAFAALEERVLEAPDWDVLAADSDVVFLALPHGLSMSAVPALLDGGAKVVDIGADFRLRDPQVFAQWYEAEHEAPQLLGEAVYGLPELHRDEIAAARLVANPGCYPTAASLALLPFAEILDQTAPVVVDAKSGVSGAGRGLSLTTHYGEVNENLQPYKVGTHRHTPEIEQALARAGAGVTVTFAPHLAPMTRGILAACYCRLDGAYEQADLLERQRARYAEAPFVRVLAERLPMTKATAGSNFCDVAVRLDERTGTVVAMAALDNLVKGAAGQAIQNMNLMFGLAEEEGLWLPALYP